MLMSFIRDINAETDAFENVLYSECCRHFNAYGSFPIRTKQRSLSRQAIHGSGTSLTSRFKRIDGKRPKMFSQFNLKIRMHYHHNLRHCSLINSKIESAT